MDIAAHDLNCGVKSKLIQFPQISHVNCGTHIVCADTLDPLSVKGCLIDLGCTLISLIICLQYFCSASGISDGLYLQSKDKRL